MRSLVKNKQNMWYSLFERNAPVYERDSEGNIIYDEMTDGTQRPRATGKKKDTYSQPVQFCGNISASGGVAEVESYGIDLSDYDAILYTPKGQLPLEEGTVIWYQSSPQFRDGEVDPSSADYKISRVPPVLDEMIYLLKGLV